MKRKQLIIIWVILFLFFAGAVAAVEIPKEIQKLGFSQDALISYEKEGREEFFTFWVDKESGDTITFIIEDGKVTYTSEGHVAKFSEQ